MKHSEIRARLSDYLDRELSPEEQSHVDMHLGACGDCRRELRELRATVALLHGLPDPAHPSGLADAVIARLASGEGREARVVSLLRRAVEPRWIAPLAAGFAGLFFLVETRDAGLQTPLPVAVAITSAGHGGASAPYSLVLGGVAEPVTRSRERDPAPRAGIIMGATPALDYVEPVRQDERATSVAVGDDPEMVVQHRAARRARVQEMAHLLRGAGHPYSTSLALHFEARPGVVLADFQPR